jgi:hypothetical protein
VITTDIMDTRFNQAEYQLNSLIPTLIEKPHMVSKNQNLSSLFITLLKQGNYQGKLFSIVFYKHLSLYRTCNSTCTS